MAGGWYNQCVQFSITVLDNMKEKNKEGPSFRLLQVRMDDQSFSVLWIDDCNT